MTIYLAIFVFTDGIATVSLMASISMGPDIQMNQPILSFCLQSRMEWCPSPYYGSSNYIT
jgi:hypothetical protein